MPRRSDINTILVIGAGPIVIGQACEFDYAGTQAVKALTADGYRVILVNSNPATIMTDPGLCARTYIEPLTPEVLERVIEREKPDVLLPTLGGQTALNLAVALAKSGVLEKHGVELIGANLQAIERAEDRQQFKAAMLRIGLELPRSGYVHSRAEAQEAVEQTGYPAIIRPSFTLGGLGASIAYNREEFDKQVEWGLSQSPRHEVLIEESVLGWKEFELEVMRDAKDNVVIVCSIENFDPMGIHTGDSITVAPAQTLTDKEYQRMRDAAVRIIREIGVATGGSNIQFAVHPETGRLVIVEMNPRVSRSSALASKATGFPIAKIAALLAVGYTLDEIPNDITEKTPSSFEPTIDYVVVKIPRFDFEKFHGTDRTLTTQMKSVGEVMAIGRTFNEAMHKAVRSLEINRDALCLTRLRSNEEVSRDLAWPHPQRLWAIAEALRDGFTVQRIHELTKVDPWFLARMAEMVRDDIALFQAGVTEGAVSDELLTHLKGQGFADTRIAVLTGMTEEAVRQQRKRMGLAPVFKRVDTCAAEFEALTPYLYSTYETPHDVAGAAPETARRSCEADPGTTRPKVVILGGGPNRIGQGIEFDYCCVHASMALSEDGFETVMVNCNPETVSTDYDISDRLYFEPLTREDVLAIVELEKPVGVIVQFGGQTPLKLAVPLSQLGVKLLGTSADAIDRAENRERFGTLLREAGLLAPPWGIARHGDEARGVAEQLGYPVLVRPSYVLGGRAMEVVHDSAQLARYLGRVEAEQNISPDHPLLVDHFLRDAIEVDVDAVSDGHEVVVAGVMEHIEEAGIHSGDSACALPPYSLGPDIIARIEEQTATLARALGVVGLMNIQFAVQGSTIYVLEVNPRASRTVPFVSKATGIPWAKVAARVMAGKTLKELGIDKDARRRHRKNHVAVKEAVFPFSRFPGVDPILGPEMRSTGETMGIDADFPMAYYKSQLAAGTAIPTSGTVFITVRDEDKPQAAELAARLRDLGFGIVATRGTGAVLAARGIPCALINKVKEGRPHIVDSLVNRQVDAVINTPGGPDDIRDSYSLRRETVTRNIPCFTTMRAAFAAVSAIEALKRSPLSVTPLQEWLGQ